MIAYTNCIVFKDKKKKMLIINLSLIGKTIINYVFIIWIFKVIQKLIYTIITSIVKN